MSAHARISAGLSLLDGVSDHYEHDFYAVRSNGFGVEDLFTQRPTLVPCKTCGQQLVDDEENDERVCPTHGPQESYQSHCGNGPKYPSANPRKRSLEREAKEMLRAGTSIRATAFRTGFYFHKLRRWRRELIAAGELA